METPNEFKQLQAQQHQLTTQTNRRSPRLMNLNLKILKAEFLLMKDVENGTIDECYDGE